MLGRVRSALGRGEMGRFGARALSSGASIVPLLDISPLRDPSASAAARKQLTDEIDRVCREIGFLAIKNHGLEGAVVDGTLDATRGFFDESEAYKQKWASTDEEKYPFGYVEYQGETLYVSTQHELGQEKTFGIPDLHASFSIGPYDPQAGMPERIWPDKPASFQPTIAAYYEEMERLANDLLEGMAESLNRPRSFFHEALQGHRSALRLLDYPAQPTPPPEGSIRTSEHQDYGIVTILLTDGEGLEVKDRSGSWHKVPDFGKEAFVINVGDMLARWSAKRWVSTPHRVLNASSLHSNNRRTSVAYFVNSSNVLVDSAEFTPEGQEPPYPPIYAHDFLMEKFLASRGKK